MTILHITLTYFKIKHFPQSNYQRSIFVYIAVQYPLTDAVEHIVRF